MYTSIKASNFIPSQPGQASALVPSATTTNGAGSALQAVPKSRKERIVRIEINSNDRDFSAYPNPAQFQWICPYPLKNITGMVVVGGTVPLPIYTIDAPYNSFTFDTGSAQVTLRIPPGGYTPLLFPPAFKRLLDAADGSNTYTVEVDPITQLLSVTTNGTNAFGFLFKSGVFKNTKKPSLQTLANPAYQMGFIDADFYAAGTTLIAPNAVNFNPIQRIYLYMNYDTSIDLRSIELAGGKRSPSAVLYCTDQDTLAHMTKSLNKDTYENVISPGLIVPRIHTINISLQDEFGNVLNTNNRPVTFLLEVSVLD